MPSITIDVPSSSDLTRVVDAICGTYNYQANIPNNGGTVPNPETKNQYSKRMVAEFLKKLTRTWEKQQAEKTAGVTADAGSINIVIT